MKSIGVCCFLMVFTFSNLLSQEQSKNIDSLLVELKNAKEDSFKIMLFHDVSKHYILSNIDTVPYFSKQGIELAKKLGFKKGEMKNLNVLGNYYENKTEYQKALETYDKALVIAREINSLEGFAMLYNNIGMVHIRQGKYDLALPLMFDALKAEEELGNQKGISQSYNNLGVIYFYQQNFNRATEYFEKSLAMEEKIGEPSAIKQAINNLGAIYDYLKDYPKAIEQYQKAFHLNTSLNDKREMATNLHNIAVAYYNLGEFSVSEEYHNQSLEMREEIGDTNGIALAYFNYGELLRKNNRFHEAKAYYENGLQIAQENKLLKIKQQIYGAFSALYEQQNDHKLANEYLYKFIAVKDSILNRENNEIIAEVEIKYQTEKKEKELLESRAVIAENELKIRRKNTLIYGTSALTLLLAILGYLLYQQQKLKNRQLQKENELREALNLIETQNKLQEQRLRISRDLHDNIGSQLTFIISALDNIKYAFKLQNEKLGDKIKNISEFTSNTIFELRDTIWAMNKPEISLEDLKVRITNFIDKARESSENIHFNFGIDKNIPDEISFSSVEGMNVYRIIQEGVHNALKYANAKSISVQINQKESDLEIIISDDGVGYNKETVEMGNGINNMKKRAKEIKAQISMNSILDAGTTIHLTLKKAMPGKLKKAS
jgi:signal transduction histidine kinase